MANLNKKQREAFSQAIDRIKSGNDVLQNSQASRQIAPVAKRRVENTIIPGPVVNNNQVAKNILSGSQQILIPTKEDIEKMTSQRMHVSNAGYRSTGKKSTNNIAPIMVTTNNEKKVELNKQENKKQITPYSENKEVKKDNPDKKWYEKILQGSEIYKDNLRRFEDGYQFGDITKTGLEYVGDTLATGAGTVADLGLGFAKGVAGIGEGTGKAISGVVAQVADWTGHEEYAEKVKNRLAGREEGAFDKKYLPTEMVNTAQSKVDKASIAGEYMDKASESIGYMSGLMLLNSVLPGSDTAAMFLNSTGNSLAEAYAKDENVEDWQAWTKAIGSGTFETVIEKSSGLLGGKGIGEKVSGKIAEQISSGAGKSLSKLLGVATDEGIEEFKSYVANYGLDRAIDSVSEVTGSEVKFSEDWNWNEVGEAMGLAFATSFIMGGSKINSDMKGEDFLARNELIDSSELGADTKQQLKTLSTQNNWSVKDLKSMLEEGGNLDNARNTPNLTNKSINNEVLQNNNEITSQDNKIAQNANMEQIEPNNQEQVKIDSANFAKQVDDYLSGKMRSNDLINVGKTSQVLQSIGLPNNDIVLKQSKLKKMLQESNDPNSNLHGLSLGVVKRIPEAIATPLNVLQSSSNKNSVVVITDLADKLERPVIASIEMNYEGKIGTIDFLSNRLTSAYGKNNYDDFMKREIAKGNLLYDIDEGIIKELAQTRVQFPASPNSSEETSSINTIIPQNENKMQVPNENIVKNTENSNESSFSMQENIAPIGENVKRKQNTILNAQKGQNNQILQNSKITSSENTMAENGNMGQITQSNNKKSQNENIEKNIKEINEFNGYTKKEIENIESNKIAIARNENDILKFVDNSKKFPSNARLYLSKVSNRVSDFINNKLGINVNNYNISLKTDDVRKIFKDHGTEKTEIPRGQIPITNEDFKNIPNIINNPDYISKSGESAQGKPAIKFEKNIDGNTVVVTYVSDKHNNLEMQTMYKFKNNKKMDSATALYENQAPRLNTSEMDSGTNPITTIIPQNENKMQVPNENIVKNTENSNESSFSMQENIAPIGENVKRKQNTILNAQKGQNNQILQNSNEITSSENIMAENGNVGQINENKRNYLMSAQKYNIDINNKTVTSIYDIAEQRGIQTKFDDTVFSNSSQNAIWRVNEDGSREVILNPNADTNKTLQSVMVHELVHDFEGSKEYYTLSEMVLEKMQTQEGFEEAIESLKEIYSKVYDPNTKNFNEIVEQEAVADFLGENLGNQEFINELVQKQDRNTVQKIYDWVVDKVKQVKNKITGNEEVLYWQKVQNSFEKAFNEDYTGQQLATSKFSIQTDKNGNQYVKVDTDQGIFEGIARKDYSKVAKMYMQDYLLGRTDLSSNDTATIDSRSVRKYTNPKQNITHLSEKMQLTPELKNVLKIAQKESFSLPSKENSKYKSWEYYKFNFELGGKNFEGTVNIGVDKNGKKHFYEINKIQLMSEQPVSAILGHKKDSFNNSIAPIGKNVKRDTTTKYSMQKNKNNTITDTVWQEFLTKNSVNQGKGETIQDVKLPIGENVKRKNRKDITPAPIITKENTEKLLSLLTKGGYHENNIEASIRKKGIEKPIEITKDGDGKIVLNDGNHRLAIANKLGLKEVPVKYLTSDIKNIEDFAKYNQDIMKQKGLDRVQPLSLKAKKLTRKEVQKQILQDMQITAEDLQIGKDLTGPNYQITDPVRVNEKVFGYELGKKINDVTINQTKHHTAEKIRWLNQERAEIASLGIKAGSKESAGVQKYGEKRWVDKNGEVHEYGEADLIKDFPNRETREKIKQASRVIRNKYDLYLEQINEALTSLGYDAIPKRKDYMRHFNELGDMFSKTGLPFNLNDMIAEDLPTDINGLTEFNRPGKSWFANTQMRFGDVTSYDAITGIDGYLEGAGNLIYHTQDIQNYRALSGLIRDSFGRTKGFENLDSLSKEQVKQRIEDIKSNKLSKYVAWLDEQANSLAGKKGAIDRGMERISRRTYSFLNTLKSQVGSNMTGFNVRSALTNFISVAQAGSKTNKVAMAKGLVSTINNMIKNDGFIDKSDFLTARFGSDSLSQKVWKRASNAGQIFMNGTDYFTSNLIARSKYYEGLQKGLTEQEALAYSNDFSSRVMGDRSQGATPEIFNSKTLGLFTQFQLEVNNQWQYMIHDTKMDFERDSKINGGLKAGAAVLFQLGQLAGYSYLLDEMFVKLTGNGATFNPVGILLTLFGVGDDEEEEKEFGDRLEEAKDMLLDNVPFVSIFTGGRIPIGSALPIKELVSGKDDYGNDKSRKKTALEALPYYVLPTGYNQVKKTMQGLSMFDMNLPLPGSFTESGNLRYTVEDDIKSKMQSALFGRWANESAQNYIDSGYQSIPSKNVEELKELEMNSTEYRKYRKELSKRRTRKEKIEYINSLKVSDKQKSIMANYVIKSDKYEVDMGDYDAFSTYEEFDFSYKNPEKYEWLKENGILYQEYKENKKEYDREYNKQKK